MYYFFECFMNSSARVLTQTRISKQTRRQTIHTWACLFKYAHARAHTHTLTQTQIPTIDHVYSNAHTHSHTFKYVYSNITHTRTCIHTRTHWLVYEDTRHVQIIQSFYHTMCWNEIWLLCFLELSNFYTCHMKKECFHLSTIYITV